ncbi:nuclear transport factor 2 family protein [Kribbella catacumbae]|uniref:nuclear transport factor 2 family protein n=1 Tax=Kribbella catacumbae TaxID=460086 RepID=UPI00036968B5|nr:nuclear transport factor 2 family protein [Kribbella catacumbae]
MSDDATITGSDDPVRAELVAIDEDWLRAIVSDDAERIGSFMADDWVIVSESGVASKEQFLSFITSGGLTHSAMDHVGEPRVQVYGEIAVLTARATNTAHYEGRRFDADEWTTSVFARRDHRWLCVLTHITPAKAP